MTAPSRGNGTSSGAVRTSPGGFGSASSGLPADGSRSVTITVRYFAAARAAAGTTDERLSVSPHDERAVCTIGDVLDAAVERHGAELQRVLLRCSFLLDEVAVHGRATPVSDGQSVDVLPPFAGG